MGKYDPKPATDEQKRDLEDLTQGWMDLPLKDHTFAQSLLFQWNTKQWLSDKQWHWVGKMASALPDRQVPDFTVGRLPEIEKIEAARS